MTVQDWVTIFAIAVSIISVAYVIHVRRKFRL